MKSASIHGRSLLSHFYDQLITKFDIEEAWADAQLKQITK